MHKLLAAIAVLATVTSSGCYFGRSPNAKAHAYVANGALAAVGAGMIGYAVATDGSCEGYDDSSCDDSLGSALALTYVAAGLIALGASGLLINAVVPTLDEEASAPTVHAEAAALITAPGLKPATIVVP